MKRTKLVLGIILKLPLLFLAIRYIVSPIENNRENWFVSFVIILGIAIVGAIISRWIIGYVKDDYLWKKVDKFYGELNSSTATSKQWFESGLASPISSFIGIIEYTIIVGGGLLSLNLLVSLISGWIIFKTAIDWKRIIKPKYRAVPQIYIISTVLSILLAIIDVLAMRALLGIPPSFSLISK